MEYKNPINHTTLNFDWKSTFTIGPQLHFVATPWESLPAIVMDVYVFDYNAHGSDITLSIERWIKYWSLETRPESQWLYYGTAACRAQPT